MIGRRRGKIICTASTAAFKGLPGLGHYTAAKHGVLGLVKTLAIELAPYNINVNAICPTTVDTGMINNQAFFDYFAGDPGPNATSEYVVARMNEMNLFRDKGNACPGRCQLRCPLVSLKGSPTYNSMHCQWTQGF